MEKDRRPHDRSDAAAPRANGVSQHNKSKDSKQTQKHKKKGAAAAGAPGPFDAEGPSAVEAAAGAGGDAGAGAFMTALLQLNQAHDLNNSSSNRGSNGGSSTVETLNLVGDVLQFCNQRLSEHLQQIHAGHAGKLHADVLDLLLEAAAAAGELQQNIAQVSLASTVHVTAAAAAAAATASAARVAAAADGGGDTLPAAAGGAGSGGGIGSTPADAGAAAAGAARGVDGWGRAGTADAARHAKKAPADASATPAGRGVGSSSGGRDGAPTHSAPGGGGADGGGAAAATARQQQQQQQGVGSKRGRDSADIGSDYGTGDADSAVVLQGRPGSSAMVATAAAGDGGSSSSLRQQPDSFDPMQQRRQQQWQLQLQRGAAEAHVTPAAAAAPPVAALSPAVIGTQRQQQHDGAVCYQGEPPSQPATAEAAAAAPAPAPAMTHTHRQQQYSCAVQDQGRPPSLFAHTAAASPEAAVAAADGSRGGSSGRRLLLDCRLCRREVTLQEMSEQLVERGHYRVCKVGACAVLPYCCFVIVHRCLWKWQYSSAKQCGVQLPLEGADRWEYCVTTLIACFAVIPTSHLATSVSPAPSHILNTSHTYVTGVPLITGLELLRFWAFSWQHASQLHSVLDAHV